MFYTPYPDELLSSWIIRNSIAQGSDPMGWVYGFWKEWRAWTRDIDRYLPPTQTFQLSRFSRLSTERIRRMTLASVVSEIEGKTPDIRKAWRWVLPTGKRNRYTSGGFQFCPLCLDEKDRFFPKQWRLSWHTHCPRHRMRYAERCGKCSMPFSPHLVDYTKPCVALCPRCGNDLRNTAISLSCGDAFAFQSLLDKAISTTFFNPFPYWNVETKRDVFVLAREAVALYTAIAKHKHYSLWLKFFPNLFPIDLHLFDTTVPFDRQNAENRAQLLHGAYTILRTSPEHLSESLKHIGITRAVFGVIGASPSAAMHPLFHLLSSKSKGGNPNGGKRAGSKEPVPPDEVEKRMRAIRRYL